MCLLSLPAATGIQGQEASLQHITQLCLTLKTVHQDSAKMAVTWPSLVFPTKKPFKATGNA